MRNQSGRERARQQDGTETGNGTHFERERERQTGEKNNLSRQLMERSVERRFSDDAPLPVEHVAEGHHVAVRHDDGDAASLERVKQRDLPEPRAADHHAKLCALKQRSATM